MPLSNYTGAPTTAWLVFVTHKPLLSIYFLQGMKGQEKCLIFNFLKRLWLGRLAALSHLASLAAAPTTSLTKTMTVLSEKSIPTYLSNFYPIKAEFKTIDPELPSLSY
jgi:hypothetical protein